MEEKGVGERRERAVDCNKGAMEIAQNCFFFSFSQIHLTLIDFYFILST